MQKYCKRRCAASIGVVEDGGKNAFHLAADSVGGLLRMYLESEKVRGGRAVCL